MQTVQRESVHEKATAGSSPGINHQTDLIHYEAKPGNLPGASVFLTTNPLPLCGGVCILAAIRNAWITLSRRLEAAWLAQTTF
jgi:hypothetical protein